MRKSRSASNALVSKSCKCSLVPTAFDINAWARQYLARFFWACWCVVVLLLGTVAPNKAVAQPAVGDRFTDSVRTEAGYRIPLPAGQWEATATKTEKEIRHVVLANRDADAVIPYLVVRYSTKTITGHWADACGSNNGSFWRSRHGTASSQLLHKCQFVFVDKLPRQTDTGRDRWTWENLYDGFRDASGALRDERLIRTFLNVTMYRNDFVIIDLFSRPSLYAQTVQAIQASITSGTKNDWATEFINWTAWYIEALKLSVIDKRYTSISPFKPPGSPSFAAAGNSAAPPSRQPPPSDQQVNADLQAALRAQAAVSRSTDEDARRKEQAALEQMRADAARRLEAAEEARRREQGERDRLSADLQQRLRIEEQERQRIQHEKEVLAQRAQQERAERERLEAEVQRLKAQVEQDRQPAAVTGQANRKALVIGNDSYRHTARLVTAREDARAMADALRRAGFTVTLQTDQGEKDMRATLRRFASQVQGGDEVVFFYAGHGVQLGGINYLIPVDVNGENEAQLRDDAVPLQRILDDMSERKAKLTLAVIDACRDNPFQTAGRSVGATRGLAPTTAATGQMIIFSAGSGQRALDSLGPNDRSRNGVFTRVFVQEMSKRGVSVDRMVRSARSEVVRLARSIGHEQVPAIYDQVIGEFFFSR